MDTGYFVPNMLLGAAYGRIFGVILSKMNIGRFSPPGTYALLGSAALLSGFTRLSKALASILVEASSKWR